MEIVTSFEVLALVCRVLTTSLQHSRVVSRDALLFLHKNLRDRDGLLAYPPTVVVGRCADHSIAGKSGIQPLALWRTV